MKSKCPKCGFIQLYRYHEPCDKCFTKIVYRDRISKEAIRLFEVITLSDKHLKGLKGKNEPQD